MKNSKKWISRGMLPVLTVFFLCPRLSFAGGMSIDSMSAPADNPPAPSVQTQAPPPQTAPVVQSTAPKSLSEMDSIVLEKVSQAPVPALPVVVELPKPPVEDEVLSPIAAPVPPPAPKEDPALRKRADAILARINTALNKDVIRTAQGANKPPLITVFGDIFIDPPKFTPGQGMNQPPQFELDLDNLTDTAKLLLRIEVALKARVLTNPADIARFESVMTQVEAALNQKRQDRLAAKLKTPPGIVLPLRIADIFKVIPNEFFLPITPEALSGLRIPNFPQHGLHSFTGTNDKLKAIFEDVAKRAAAAKMQVSGIKVLFSNFIPPADKKGSKLPPGILAPDADIKKGIYDRPGIIQIVLTDGKGKFIVIQYSLKDDKPAEKAVIVTADTVAGTAATVQAGLDKDKKPVEKAIEIEGTILVEVLQEIVTVFPVKP